MTAILQADIKYSIDWVFSAWRNVWCRYYCAVYWLCREWGR